MIDPQLLHYPPKARMPARYWRARCPRCRAPALVVWPHEHSRFVCEGTCAAYEARCDNLSCEYPSPKGLAAWCSRNGDVVWQHGRAVDADIERIMRTPIEPLPAPFNTRVRY